MRGSLRIVSDYQQTDLVDLSLNAITSLDLSTGVFPLLGAGADLSLQLLHARSSFRLSYDLKINTTELIVEFRDTKTQLDK